MAGSGKLDFEARQQGGELSLDHRVLAIQVQGFTVSLGSSGEDALGVAPPLQAVSLLDQPRHLGREIPAMLPLPPEAHGAAKHQQHGEHRGNP